MWEVSAAVTPWRGGGSVRGRDECAEEMTTCVVQLQAGSLLLGGHGGSPEWTNLLSLKLTADPNPPATLLMV